MRDSGLPGIIVCRWVPHDQNPVDCMSKLKGNTSRMLQLFRDRKYRLVAEEVEMEERREYTEATGSKNPRPKRQSGPYEKEYEEDPFMFD